MDARLLLHIYCVLLLTLSIGCAKEIIASEITRNDNVRCIPKEREALLKFKNAMERSERLASWGNDNECCEWSGVLCSNTTGHVTRLDLSESEYDGCVIDPSLFELQHLNYLNLSYNNHGNCRIPEFIGNLRKLVQLDLSNSRFGGTIPYQLGNLSPLQFLDLSRNNFSGSSIPDTLGFLRKLSHLEISSSSIGGKLPYQLGNLSRLQFLGLGDNHLQGLIPHNVIGNMPSLIFLDLSNNQFEGEISSIFGWTNSSTVGSSLEYLILGSNQLRGNLPESGGLPHKLKQLDLSSNSLYGVTSEIHFKNLSNLEYLSLSSNNLTIRFSLGSMPSLTFLDLSNNQFEGEISSIFGWTNSSTVGSSLEYLILGSNQLRGSLPESVGLQHKLKWLDLSSNSLDGVISEIHFKNLSNLKYLSLSSNNLTIHFSPNWIPPFQLESIYLGSCNLGPQFPDWLKTQTRFSALDISFSQISDAIPNWFWSSSSEARLLNISNNAIHGAVPKFLSIVTDLSSNQFEGPLPLFPSIANFIDLSKNKFSGSISSICQSSGWILQMLDLSDNFLSGEFPECWQFPLQNMHYLSLSNNRLTGKINSTSFVPNCQMRSLFLNNNSFVGELPVSLGYCNGLRVLDVGYNMLSGPIPGWIGANFTDLSILILRSNQFSGTIPSNLCWLWKIRVLDLSYNNLSGSAIKCLSNSTALTTKENLQLTSDAETYYDMAYLLYYTNLSLKTHGFIRRGSVSLSWQGKEREYTSTLRFMKMVDFSSNFLQGQIPEDFGRLVGLISLNMSNNNLSGHIPQTIGEMVMLQVLDLSTNQLLGEIPQSISSLSFLNYLDLSDNNLTGQIPTGTQIQTQSASSFLGNIGLCGLPLPKKCLLAEAPAPKISSHEDEDEDEIISNGFYISMGVGFVIGLWGILGCLLFKNAWSLAYFHFLKSATDWLYVRSQLMNARLRRRAL